MSKVNTQESQKCFGCNSAVYPAKKKHATCVMCQNHFHFKCTDVTSEKYKAISSTNNGFLWFCEHCYIGAKNLLKHITDFEKTIESRICNLENNLKDKTINKDQEENLASTMDQSSATCAEPEVKEDGNLTEDILNENLSEDLLNTCQEAPQPTLRDEKENASLNSLPQDEPATSQSADFMKVGLDSQQQNQENIRPICQPFIKGQCPKGLKGKGCQFSHPKQCKKFLHGGRFSHGCTNWKCPLMHPQMCSKSYIHGSCHTRNCKERHLQESPLEPLTKNQNHTVPVPSSQNLFLWQSQMELKIGLILEALKPQSQTLSQMKPVSKTTQEVHHLEQQIHSRPTRTRIIRRSTPRV